MSKRDYYEVLGVPRSADELALKTAYRKLARQFHPDINKAPDSEERLKEINEAYAVLSDPDKRAGYDRYGHAATQGGPGGPGGFGGAGGFGGFGGFSDIFEEFFGGFAGQRTPQRGPTRGRDLRYTMEITFREAVFGAEKEIEIPRLETCPVCQGSGAEPGTRPMRCPQCNGTGEVRRVQQTILGQFVSVSVCPRCEGEREIVTTPCHQCGGRKRVKTTRKLSVNIPAGVSEGMRIRLNGEGEPGERGGPAGDLYVELSVKSDPQFERVDNDIRLEYLINFVQAALGAAVEVPTLEGVSPLIIPPGTQNGATFRLKNQGVPVLRSNRRGDQVVAVRVGVPESLTPQQRELLEQFGATLNGNLPVGDKRNFLEKLLDRIGKVFG